jgi:uncharacterized SAM-binding protein YcdF (DUF218 family)
MLFYLSKLLVLPFYPVGLAMILLVAGIAALFRQMQKTGRILVMCAAIVLYLFSAGPLPDVLLRSFELQYTPSLTYPPASAIVLLTGGEVQKMPPRLYDEINDAGDRDLYAARLLKQQAAKLLIITGGSIPFLRKTDRTESEAAYRIIADFGMADTTRILLETKAKNTYENGAFTKNILDSLKLPRTVILVTSALHMPRSVAIFKKLGYSVIPAPTDYTVDVPGRWTPLSLLPSADALYHSTSVMHELYGIIAYRLLGRL